MVESISSGDAGCNSYAAESPSAKMANNKCSEPTWVEPNCLAHAWAKKIVRRAPWVNRSNMREL